MIDTYRQNPFNFIFTLSLVFFTTLSMPVSSAPRLIDSEKGLEHEGRHLAGEMNVEWKERFAERDSEVIVSDVNVSEVIDI